MSVIVEYNDKAVQSEHPGASAKEKPLYQKEWDELNDSQKIERMREYVKNSLGRIDGLRNTVDKLENHVHNEKGEMLIPYVNRYGYESAEKIGSTKNYF